jgi:hypothetical protein
VGEDRPFHLRHPESRRLGAVRRQLLIGIEEIHSISAPLV